MNICSDLIELRARVMGENGAGRFGSVSFHAPVTGFKLRTGTGDQGTCTISPATSSHSIPAGLKLPFLYSVYTHPLSIQQF